MRIAIWIMIFVCWLELITISQQLDKVLLVIGGQP